MKKTFKFAELPGDQEWKVDFIKEIVNLRYNVLFLGDENDDSAHFTAEELNEIMNYLATS